MPWSGSSCAGHRVHVTIGQVGVDRTSLGKELPEESGGHVALGLLLSRRLQGRPVSRNAVSIACDLWAG
jgi:hypothetical protein